MGLLVCGRDEWRVTWQFVGSQHCPLRCEGHKSSGLDDVGVAGDRVMEGAVRPDDSFQLGEFPQHDTITMMKNHRSITYPLNYH